MTLRVLSFIIACLSYLGVQFATASTAGTETPNIALDGTIVYIPEIKLIRKTNPVTTFLYIGSWGFKTRAEKLQGPLCKIDAKNNTIHIEYPERILENSRTRVVTRENVNAFLDSIPWGQRQATYIAFKLIAPERQSAIVEINTTYNTTLYHNGKYSGSVSAENIKATGGVAYLLVSLEQGENVIVIEQFSIVGKPLLQLAVNIDHSHDLTTARQTQGGLLKKLLYIPTQSVDFPALTWDEKLDKFSPALEVRDLTTNKIILQKQFVRQGRLFNSENQIWAPGIYEATYRTKDESASEFFMVGNPKDLFASLEDTLSQYNPDLVSKLDIEAQLRRARVLLAEENYNIFDRQWQEQTAYTFSCLATFGRRLKEGVVNIAKDQTGLHIRGFSSAQDGSTQFYRLYIPSTYTPDSPLPLLVIAPTRIHGTRQPFIEGSVISNYAEAFLWAKYAEKYGFAILWPGYRGASEGQTYESVQIDEAIQAVEKDYTIDKQRISVYAACGAGYNAGRLISEYNDRFSAIVYDLAVFDYTLDKIQIPSLKEWYETVNPSRRVIANRNLKIFIMHDDTKPYGHSPLALTTEFLSQARETRDDIVSYISKRLMATPVRMDKIFSWLVPCKNESPNNHRSYFLKNTGYMGPIMEIFTTPILVVEGTHATNADLEGLQSAVKSLQNNYKKYFYGAECVVKKDTEVTQEDILSHSLVLVGNPQSNSIWEKLQPQLLVKVVSSGILYENNKLTGDKPFQAIVRHPHSDDKFVLIFGASDLKTFKQVQPGNIFNAWYDCITTDPKRIFRKLSTPRNTRSNMQINMVQNIEQ